jgi:hypothetical protein
MLNCAFMRSKALDVNKTLAKSRQMKEGFVDYYYYYYY